MKYTEKVGDYEMTYEGEPKEIAELQSFINPKILTIKDVPLIDAERAKKELFNELIKEKSENIINCTVNIPKDIDLNNANENLSQYLEQKFQMENLKEIKNLEELCEPIVKYLKKNHDPYCSVIISDEYIKLVRDDMGIPLNK